MERPTKISTPQKLIPMHAVDLHRMKKFKLGKMPLTHQVRYTFLPLNVPAIIYDIHIHVEIGYCALTSQYTVQNVFHIRKLHAIGLNGTAMCRKLS